MQVALKTLIVIHRTLREGDPTFREELLNYSNRGHILQVSYFKDDSSPLGKTSLHLVTVPSARSCWEKNNQWYWFSFPMQHGTAQLGSEPMHFSWRSGSSASGSWSMISRRNGWLNHRPVNQRCLGIIASKLISLIVSFNSEIIGTVFRLSFAWSGAQQNTAPEQGRVAGAATCITATSLPPHRLSGKGYKVFPSNNIDTTGYQV